MDELELTTWSQDLDGDGYEETMLLDRDGDDVADAALYDLDGDGLVDATVVVIDVDGDGVAEFAVYDLDGDGLPDLVVDVEGTGEGAEAPTASPASVDPPTPVSPTNTSAPSQHGEPLNDLQWSIHQSENGFCMPASVAMIASEMTGHPVTEASAVASGIGLNLLDGEPGSWTGMNAQEGEQLLEHFGVPAHTEQGDLNDLRQYLDEGRGIILGIDSSEVWEGIDDDLAPGGNKADHALVITGINDSNGMVTLNDPGHPDGAGMQVPIAVLLDAWADSGNTMVVTDMTSAPPQSPQSSFAAGFVLLPVTLTGVRS